ncbi:MAG: metal ABC transporter permease [bacterium]|nr:metal ABC transporter permease [bacterium]
MGDFFSALGQHGFLQLALLAGVLVSVPCGVVGSFVVIRRISYMAGAIAHTVLAGLGLVHYLQVVHNVNWLSPMLGAVVAALLAAGIIGWVSLNLKQREDTVIGAVWAMGMALGIVFINLTPGYSTDLMSYLFGNILMISHTDIWLVISLDVIVLVCVGLFHKQLLAVCFDSEFATLRGVHVNRFHFLLLGLTALTVVLLVSVVGIILVIALLTLPAAMANLFSRSLGKMMVTAVLICMAMTTGGLALSYGPDLPSGAVTILLTGMAYFITAFVRGNR